MKYDKIKKKPRSVMYSIKTCSLPTIWLSVLLILSYYEKCDNEDKYYRRKQ